MTSFRVFRSGDYDPLSNLNHEGPVNVASYRPNGWGLYDMHGNVWEWTKDWHAPYPEGDAINPGGPDAPSFEELNVATRVLRGGSFYDAAGMARSGNRWNYSPSVATEYIGFRVVREIHF